MMTDREIDIHIGEKIYGWEVGVYEGYRARPGITYVCRDKAQGGEWNLPHFSTKIKDAMSVIAGNDVLVERSDFTEGKWSVRFGEWSDDEDSEYRFCGASDESLPKAICLARLKSMEHCHEATPPA